MESIKKKYYKELDKRFMNSDQQVEFIIKEAQKELLEELQTMININEQNRSEDVLNQWIYRKLKSTNTS